MQLWKAKKIAEEVVSLLSPYCHEIIVAGSVRRGKREYIKDIDLVIHPCVEAIERQPSLLVGFDADMVVTSNLLTNYLSTRQQIDMGIDVVSVGNVRHRLHHHAGNIDIELYCITDLAQRGIAVLTRTGPALFSQRFMSFVLYLHWHVTGQQLHTHPKAGKHGNLLECKKGAACPLALTTETEADVFEAVGLPFIEPEARTPELLQQLERERLNIKAGSVWP